MDVEGVADIAVKEGEGLSGVSAAPIFGRDEYAHLSATVVWVVVAEVYCAYGFRVVSEGYYESELALGVDVGFGFAHILVDALV